MKINNIIKVHVGIIIDVYEADVESGDTTFPIQTLKHPGAVCVAATLNGEDFFMVRQYRFGLGESMLEFPAGKIDNPDEDPILGAHRELLEETGYQANTMLSLGKIHPAPAYIDEVIHLYFATDLTYQGQALDEHEELELETHTLDEILEMTYNDKITDAKTVALAHKVKYYLSK